MREDHKPLLLEFINYLRVDGCGAGGHQHHLAMTAMLAALTDTLVGAMEWRSA